MAAGSPAGQGLAADAQREGLFRDKWRARNLDQHEGHSMSVSMALHIEKINLPDKCWEGRLRMWMTKSGEEKGENEAPGVDFSETSGVEFEDKSYLPGYGMKLYKFIAPLEVDLRAFPFDRQLLNLHNLHFFYCVDAPNMTFQTRRWAKVTELEIEVKNEVEDWIASGTMITTEYNGGCSGGPRTNFKILVDLSRIPSFFVENVMSLCTMTTAFGVYAFFMDGGVGSRLPHIVTVLLTLIAIKFSIAAYLPVVNYLTYFDRYVLRCLALLSFSALESLIVQEALTSDHVARVVDRSSAGVFVFVLIGIHAHVLLMGTARVKQGLPRWASPLSKVPYKDKSIHPRVSQIISTAGEPSRDTE